MKSNRPVGVATERGQPVGDAEHGDVDLNRLAGREVAVDGPRRQRLFVHKEAEAQVMTGQRRDMSDQPLAGAQSREDPGRHLRSAHVVLEEGRAALGADRAGEWFGDVMYQSAEPQRLAARELVGQRLVEDLPQAGPEFAERGAGIVRNVDRRLERRERVLIDVEVVVVALLETTQRVQLGQHGGRRTDAVRQLDPRHRTIVGDGQTQLREHTLGGNAGKRGR